MKIYGLTDRGAVREANEDCIGITRLKGGICIAVVCDGMGGAAGGRIASEIAEATFMREMIASADDFGSQKYDAKKIKSALKHAAEEANAAVIARAREDLSLYGMGCTLCALVFCEAKSRIYYINIGDSRLYMIDRRAVRQLTKDHSYVQMLVDSKEITAKEAENHPQRNLITRAVGIRDELEPDIYDRRIGQKDGIYLLLCSDGLHGMLTLEQIQSIARSEAGIEEKVFEYIRAANEAGGTDNISAILMAPNAREDGK